MILFLSITITCFGKPLPKLTTIYKYSSNEEQEAGNVSERTAKNIDEYRIEINGNYVGKTMKVYEYDSGSYISLRELVEGMGGRMEWTPFPAKEPYYLGSFTVFGTKFKYFSNMSFDSYDDKERYLLYDIYMSYNGKDIEIPMGNWTKSISGKYVNNNVLVGIQFVNAIFPRVGYIGGFCKETGTFRVKKYDYTNESKLIKAKFPNTKFLEMHNIYTEKYKGYVKLTQREIDDSHVSRLAKNSVYRCEDIYEAMFISTMNLYAKYFDYIDPDFNYNVPADGNIEFYKNMLKAYYVDDFEGTDIKVRYDKDLDAYIIYNKEYEYAEKIDNSYAMIVIRRIDNALLLANNWIGE